MLYLDRIDFSEGIDVNKISEWKSRTFVAIGIGCVLLSWQIPVSEWIYTI